MLLALLTMTSPLRHGLLLLLRSSHRGMIGLRVWLLGHIRLGGRHPLTFSCCLFYYMDARRNRRRVDAGCHTDNPSFNRNDDPKLVNNVPVSVPYRWVGVQIIKIAMKKFRAAIV